MKILLCRLFMARHSFVKLLFAWWSWYAKSRFLLSQDEFNQLLDTAESVLSKAGMHGYIVTETPYCIVKNPDKYHYIHMATTCAAGKGFFVIDPSGNVKVCNHSPQICCHWTEIEKFKQTHNGQRPLANRTK